MARRKGSGPLVRLARLALILALNVAAVYALWLTWPREAEVLADGASLGAEAAEGGPVGARGALERLARPATPPARPRAQGVLRTVETGSRSIVARWMESARELSKNKVHAGNAAVAVCVREFGVAATGEVDLGAERSLTPASNMKLVTTAAALALLGPNWNFETRFEGSGPVVDGVLEGDLVVRAAGDPLFDKDSRGDVDGLLQPLIEALEARGVRSIRGDVVLDEGAFGEPGPAPQWPPAEQFWAEYCALSGGFSANRGCLTAVVRPTAVGDLARVEVRPRGHGLEERIGVRTVSDPKLVVHVGASSGGVLVSGSMPARTPEWSDSFSAPDPVQLFGNVLCAALERGGVALGGALVRKRHPPGGAELFTLRTPLWTCLDEINADSTNSVADQVLLALGNAAVGAGTREAGARATRDALTALGVSTEGFEQADGSGLSRGNRVSARQIVALLEAVLASDATSARRYLDSLAVAGVSGTLSSRMKGSAAAGRVRAKTGFINGASSLSGFVERDDGRIFVFSILVNYPHVDGLNANCWKKMQDELCELLASVKA
jgi:D-alanyl-D-alanine carboxypeptidase/D-alanyl-D-alanine-endopeptidase (penicillin-binding protein 4)